MEALKSLISTGKIDEAIDQLIHDFGHSDYLDELILLSARNATNQKNRRLELVRLEDYQVEKNKIVHSVLGVIELLQEEKQDSHKVILEKRVLFCEANPLHDRNLMSNVEYREIEDIIHREGSSLQLILKMALSLDRFIESVNEVNPAVLHITAFANDEGLYFHDKTDAPAFIPNATFLQHVQMIQSEVACIFFNTFISEDLAQSLSTNNVLVIGFNEVIDSHGAIEFATGFYTALRYGKDYQAAFRMGYQTVSHGNHQNILPRLYAYVGEEKVIPG